MPHGNLFDPDEIIVDEEGRAAAAVGGDFVAASVVGGGAVDGSVEDYSQLEV